MQTEVHVAIMHTGGLHLVRREISWNGNIRENVLHAI